MATAKSKTEKDTSTELAAPAATGGALATVNDDMFAADSGAGMEGATSDSFAIPFLSVLQKGSPTVDEALPTYVEGHKAGMFYENVTGRTFDGKAGVTIVPCAYRRVFLRWGPKGVEGSGFKGEILPEQVAQLRADGKIVDLDGRLYFPLPDGTVNDKKCDRVADVRNHYVLLVDRENGGWTQALLSLGSTQIKKSKMLMSALASVKFKGAAGMFTPPTFANVVTATSIGESNDKGTWHGVKFELAGKVDRAEVYAAAKAFHASVSAGLVEAKYEGAAPAGEDDARGGF
jgi:hypothetical protein